MDRDLPLLDTVKLADGDDSELEPATYGRFISRGVIGRGGMGIVLRANDPELDRDVALKLLRPTQWKATESSLGAQRLQREAQAMAKLSHPNVVTVYEMGRIGEARFIAMELVEGTTLGGWLAAENRPWRAIVAAFVQCGRGLAAAHEAELVHRDFKPENVLIGADGRPRVADFGLVADGVAIEAADLGGAPLDDELSVHGAIVGTPAYMSPEQWLGEDVDARTDQFAFCVALWDALFGERPFIGAGSGEVRAAVLAGHLRAPGTRKIARSLAPILRRGLARDRDERWPTMTRLIDALERTLESRFPAAWIITGGVLIAGAAVAAVMLSRSTAESCAVPTDQLAGVWDSVVRARVTAAMQASASSDAAQPARLRTALDEYANEWLTASVAACRATQTQSLLRKRTLCLERGRMALAAFTRTLITADRATVERADAAVARLPDLTACSDLERLDATVAGPVDPALRARMTAVEQQLDAIEALQLQGRHSDALAVARSAVAEARAIGHAPTLALALNWLGDIHSTAGEHTAAEGAYREAASAAADGHDDRVAAEAWANVLFSASERNENLDAAAALDPVVDAAVRRAGDPPRLRLSYLMASGALADRRNDFDTAYARYAAAGKVATNPRHRAQAMRNLAIVIWRRDGATAAADTAVAAVKLTEDALGPDHLDTADALYSAAQVVNGTGRAAEAKPLAERALAIQVRRFGPDSTAAATVYGILGNIESNLHDAVAARVHLERALAIAELAKVPDYDLAMAVGAVGALLQYESHQPAEAVPYYERSIMLLARSSGTDTLEYLMISSNLAATLEELGRCAAARPIIAKVQPGLTKMPAQYPELLITIGRCERAANVPAAIAAFEQANALCVEHDACDPGLTNNIRWELGSTLAWSKRDAARGRSLVQEARDAALAADPKDPLIATMDTWLRAHAK